jgi:hypothetical protein
MSTLVIPNTLANGDVADAPTLMENFDAIATWANGDVGTANMEAAYGLFSQTFSVAALAGAGVAYFRWKVPSGIAMQPVSVQLAYQTEAGASSASLTLAVVGGASIITSTPLAVATAATMASTATFNAASIAANSELLATVTAGANALTYITVTIFWKALLQASAV